jgi:TetR/AcrR family tetracycline transcriptional repressor
MARTDGRRTSRYAGPRDATRPALDRDAIVAAALELLGREGAVGLSTRALASALGIKSASLYWHFRDKDELLDAMCGAMFEEAIPPPAPEDPGFDWAGWLAQGARDIRRTALSRRDGALVMARPRPMGPDTRLPFERNVKALMRSGLSARESILVFQTLRRFAIGSALQEQATPDASPDEEALVGEKGFEFGLQVFLDGVRARLAAKAKAAGRRS